MWRICQRCMQLDVVAPASHLYADAVPLALLFFFFQAEDGIRDGHVTGVQTCALPISLGRENNRQLPARIVGQVERTQELLLRRHLSGARSEERRVGKECRSRWAP